MGGAPYVVGCLTLTVAGQVLVKIGAERIGRSGWLSSYALNIPLILGLLSAVGAAVFWIQALRRLPLSVAYPFMSLSFPLVALLATRVLGETMTTSRWLGLLVIVAGLVVGSR